VQIFLSDEEEENGASLALLERCVLVNVCKPSRRLLTR